MHLKLLLLHSFKAHGYNITPEQWAILFKLWEKDGQYQKQLGDSLLKDKPNITRILDLLQKRGLIERINDTADRRKFKIYLTEKGKIIIQEIIPIVNKLKESLYKNLSSEEIKNLKITLNKIYEGS